MIRKAAISSVAAAMLVACTTTAEPPANQASVDQYVAEARRIAGEDLKFLMPVCNPQPAVRAAPSAAMDAGLARLINQPAPVPGQAFDNLYYVGSAWVSAWVLKTSEGLILIDALNNTKEAADLIEGGMRRLGLDPAQIRYVLVTPGHTLGTISPVFDVRQGGKVHKAMIWGGTAFNFGRDMGRLDGYIAQTERMRQLAARWGIDVPLSNHPGYDGTVAKLKARAAAPAGANPFVSGQPVVDRAMRVLNTCARAQKARFLLAGAGGAGEMYASTPGAREGALGGVVQDLAAAGAPLQAAVRDDGGRMAGEAHPGGPASGEVPRVFPHSVHADDHAGLCAHGEH